MGEIRRLVEARPKLAPVVRGYRKLPTGLGVSLIEGFLSSGVATTFVTTRGTSTLDSGDRSGEVRVRLRCGKGL